MSASPRFSPEYLNINVILVQRTQHPKRKKGKGTRCKRCQRECWLERVLVMAKGKPSVISPEIRDLIKRTQDEIAAKVEKWVAEGYTEEEVEALLHPKPPYSAPTQPTIVRERKIHPPNRITVLVGKHALGRLGRASQRPFSSSSITPLEKVEEMNQNLNRGFFYAHPKQLNTYFLRFSQYGTLLVLKPKPANSDVYYAVTYKSDIYHTRGRPIKIHYRLREEEA